MKNIKIANKIIGEKSPPFLIAEAGINHNGSLKRALKMVEIAKKAGVKQLVLYHHSPANDDNAIRVIEKDAQAVFPNTIAARAGLEIKLST